MKPIYNVYSESMGDSGIGEFPYRRIISRHRDGAQAIAAITVDTSTVYSI